MTSKYDRIGVNYNETRKADNYLSGRMHDLLRSKPEGLYLDVGCGTGNYTIELAKKGVNFIAIDPSERMLNLAKSKYDKIDWRLGEAENTGLDSDSIHGILGSLTMHHWTDLNIAFRELYRIMKSGGTMVLFTSTSEQMKFYWLNHYFPRMMNDSIQQMPSLKIILEALKQAGFDVKEKEKYFVKPDLDDHFLYCGKDRPWLYLEENIRKGISSFSDLANMEEIEFGLSRLENDIEEGRINEIMQRFKSEEGDYLFLVAQK